jgi:hypothetical protein
VKRSEALAPLSRDHHQALETALRLRRATDDSLEAALARLDAFWTQVGQRLFEIEEELLLPALSGPEWAALSARVCDEHADIRRRAAALEQERTVAATRDLGERLDAHVRFEERELFAHLEAALDAAGLDRLGRAVEAAEAAR